MMIIKWSDAIKGPRVKVQGVNSSDAIITQRLIVSRFTETDGSYIEYLTLPELVTVLDSPEHQNRRSWIKVWCQYTKVRLVYRQILSA